MKKHGSQIAVAIVCCILGFIITYQFRTLMKQEKGLKITASSKESVDITAEIEQYKKSKEEMEKKLNELQVQVKKYEDDIAKGDNTSKSMLEELDKNRVLIGTTDVQGPGIVLYLNPETKVIGSTKIQDTIMDRDLVYIVNELTFAGAEAISINDLRITSRTGIRTSNGGTFININDERVSPQKRITIKAIGDKNLLYSSLTLPGTLGDFTAKCDIKIEKQDIIKISKYNRTYKTDYAKPVTDKK